MAITLGVHASAGSSNGNTAGTPSRSVTTGACLVACVGWGGGTAGDATLSDNAGNTWLKIGTSLGPTTTGGYSVRGVMYKCENCTGNAAFVLTATRSGEYPSVAFQEYLGTSVVVEAIASGPEDSATPWTSATVTPAANGAGLFSGFVNNANVNPTYGVASPFSVVEGVTDTGSYYPMAAAAGIQTTAAAIAASWTMGTATGAGLVWTVALREDTGGTAYTLTADGATFAETGAAASLLLGRRVAADAGALTLTGADATLVYDAADAYTFTAEAAAFALTGAAATLARGRRLTAEAGAFVLASGGSDVELGSHTLKWVAEGSGVDPHVSDPITTVSGSDLFVSVAAANGLDNTPTDNYGNTFTRYGSRINYTLWSGYGVSTWRATNIAGGSGHTITIQKDLDPDAEMSMYVVEIRGATSLSGGMDEDLTDDPLISDPVTVSGHAVLYAHWWGDQSSGPHTADAQDGFTALESALTPGSNMIQTASAYRVVHDAGTYDVEWIETPNQGALLGLFAFEGATGGVTDLFFNRVLPADAGAVGLTGADATLTYSALNNYTLTAEAGAFALTGAAAETVFGRALAAEAGAVALTGAAADLRVGHVLAAETGAVALTGADAALLFGRVLAFDSAAFALTGADAALLIGRTVEAAPGAYALIGSEVTFPMARVLGADSASYALTGIDATLVYNPVGSYTLVANQGDFALTGAAAGLVAARRFDAEGAAFTLTGADAALERGWSLAAAEGGFALTGAAADLVYVPAGSYSLAANAGAFALTGAEAELTYVPALEYMLAAEGAAYTLAGGAAQWLRSYYLTGGSAAYILTGTAANLFFGPAVPPLPPTRIVMEDEIVRIVLPDIVTTIKIDF